MIFFSMSRESLDFFFLKIRAPLKSFFSRVFSFILCGYTLTNFAYTKSSKVGDSLDSLLFFSDKAIFFFLLSFFLSFRVCPLSRFFFYGIFDAEYDDARLALPLIFVDRQISPSFENFNSIESSFHTFIREFNKIGWMDI